jgi:hypothetical protein
MGLSIWNLLTDPYDHAQLADNFSKIDLHDHTPGRGIQIPTEGITDGAVTAAKLAANLDPSLGYATYKDVHWSGGSTAAPAANTFIIPWQGTNQNLLAAANTNAYLHAYSFYFDPADYAVSGKSTVLRTRAFVANNAVAPAITFTFGLYPISTIGGASGSAPFINSLGSVTSGSTVAIASPSASVITSATGTNFIAPSAGYYVLAVVTSGAAAANSVPQVFSKIQVRQV